MSSKATAWAWEIDDLDVYEKLILLRLADHANAEGSCWPGKDLLTQKCRCSKRKVDKSINNLEALGLIKVNRRTSANGKNQSNVYFLQLNQGRLFDEKEAAGVHGVQGCTADGGVPDAGVGVHHRPNRGARGAPEPKNLEPKNKESYMAQPPAGDRAVHDFFEKQLWPNRPMRKGTDNKLEALDALCESVKRGNKLEDIQAGVKRYAAHIKATNQGDTRFVMRFSKFLGAKDYWKQKAWGPDGSTAPSNPATNNKPKDEYWHASMPGIWQKASDYGIMLHAYPDHTDLMAELIKRLEAAGEEVPEQLRERRKAMIEQALSP